MTPHQPAPTPSTTWPLGHRSTARRQARVMQLRVERLAGGGLPTLALHLQDQFPFDQAFYDIVAADGTGVFQVTDDSTGQVTAEYYRPEGVLSSYTASVRGRSWGPGLRCND